MLESLLEALKFSPNNVALKLQIAKLYAQNGDYTNCEKQLYECIDLDSTHKDAKYELANCFYKQGKTSAAEVLLEEITKNSNNIKYLELLCYCQLKQDNYNDAQDTYKDILTIDHSYINEDFDRKLKITTTSSFDDDDDDDFADEDAISFMKKPEVSFKDIGGMHNVKKEISLKIIKPLEHKDLYKAYGKKIGGGILLYGPPGCGKTHLARATAGEINANFINVGINDILDMWIGSSERNLHEIFETARENTPCVIFIDEIDALGANRNDMNKNSGRTVINQFLAELDGIDADNDGILVIGATNAPWYLDPAFRRPGRFDRIIFVSPPDTEAREEIFTIQLKDKPIETIDYSSLAKVTKEFSGADIKATIDVAIESKLEEAFKDGIPKPLSTKDILKAAKKMKATTKEWFSSAKNYALYSNDGGLYDEILTYLNIKK
ncbi:ATP-binding protein [Cellulophaga baltica]|uniref:Cell division protein n=1 Tax=Cellulophaga baltica 18 TaxID=1348584 RepID=A0AAU8RBJ9_9FLAO|nr:ATP-binding protein [Cellulophaga baltica]AIZ41126.1 cell division protein [Cellulophaga baltica 18]